MSHNAQTSQSVKWQQVNKQLAEFRDALKTDETRLAADEAEIRDTQSRVGEFKGLGEKVERAEKELEKTRVLVDAMSVESKQFRVDIGGLQGVVQRLQKDYEPLKGQLHAAEKKTLQQTEITQNETLETKPEQLENKNHGLEGCTQKQQTKPSTQNENPVTPAAKKPPERAAASTLSFHIDLCSSEGDYHGKIEKMVTGEKKPLTGMYEKEIVQFISSHLLHLDASQEGSKAKANLAPEASPESETKSGAGDRILLSELNAFQPGTDAPRKLVVCKREPFQVQLTADLSNVRSRDLPLVYELKVYAEHLESKVHHVIGETTTTIASAGVLPVRLRVSALPPGMYRLQANLTSKHREGKLAPYKTFVEGGLVLIE